jgi:hypothetical protein
MLVRFKGPPVLLQWVPLQLELLALLPPSQTQELLLPPFSISLFQKGTLALLDPKA